MKNYRTTKEFEIALRKGIKGVLTDYVKVE